MGMMDNDQDAVKSVLAIDDKHITTSSEDNSNSRVAFATEKGLIIHTMFQPVTCNH